jgi:hypothetical protein
VGGTLKLAFNGVIVRLEHFHGVRSRIGTVDGLERAPMHPFLIRVAVDRADADLHGVAVDLNNRTSQTFCCVERLIEILRTGAGATDRLAVSSDERLGPNSPESG